MTQAYYTGISGIKSSSTGIDAISNNLANVNTTGYRAYTTEFASLFENSIATSVGLSDTAGVGVTLQASSMVLDQGSFALSDKSTDMAIMGNGWFGIQGEADELLYTRDGSFTFDVNNDLVTADGHYVLGTIGHNISDDDILTERIDEIELGAINAQEKLRFPKTLTYPPEPTTEAEFFGNLGIGNEGEESVTLGATLVDSQNNKNHLSLLFTKAQEQVPPGTQWDVTASVKSSDGETLYDTQTGSVSFSESGAIISSTLSSIDNNGTAVNIDLGTGYDGVVSIDVPTLSPGSSKANGAVGGDLMGYSINENAEVVATFSNGEQSSVGKIALYHFGNEQGLNRVGGTRFQESSNSGEPIFYTNEDGEYITGAIISNYKLESSNVDIATGLTELIVMQRSFDANSKSITTANEMIQKALNMDG